MRRVLMAATLASLVVLVGCSSEQPGSANPTTSRETVPPNTSSSHESNSGSKVPAYGAPSVDNPLDLSHFMQAPCTALSEAQVHRLLGQAANTVPRSDDAEGPACGWSSEQTDGLIKVSFPTITDLGLSRAYGLRDTKYKLFIELPPVAGYPAIAYDVADDRDEGKCIVEVGTSNHRTFSVGVHLSTQNAGKKDPCAVGHMIAGMVMTNIKGVQ